MISVETLPLRDANAIESLCDSEHSAQHARQGKVGTQCFFGKRETFSLQTLGEEADVPCIHRARCESSQIIELASRHRLALGRELLQEFANFADGRGHLGGE